MVSNWVHGTYYFGRELRVKPKSQKRLEAMQRQAEADTRSPRDQLARLNARGEPATRERAKLQAKLLKEVTI